MANPGMTLLGLLIDALAPRFGGRRNFDSAFKLAVYSYTPVWLAGIFLLAPGLRFLGLTGFYGAYILWCGLPRLMKTPARRVPPYAAVIVAGACALALITAAARHALFGSAGTLEHDPEKWEPVFRKDHAPTKI